MELNSVTLGEIICCGVRKEIILPNTMEDFISHVMIFFEVTNKYCSQHIVTLLKSNMNKHKSGETLRNLNFKC